MSRDPSGSVTVRLGVLRQPLVEYCAECEVSLSDGIRQILCQALSRDNANAEPVSFDNESTDRIRLNVRLMHAEYQAILKRVEADGFTSVNRWIVSLIRANLQKEPEFGETGLDALYESNRLLAPLARNLNQLTRDVRQQGIRVPPYRFSILEHLQTALSAHIKVVANVISRNVGRWRTE